MDVLGQGLVDRCLINIFKSVYSSKHSTYYLLSILGCYIVKCLENHSSLAYFTRMFNGLWVLGPGGSTNFKAVKTMNANICNVQKSSLIPIRQQFKKS